MKNPKLFITMASVFLIDRIFKMIILKTKVLYYPIIPKYLSITSVTNTGAAFSLLQNHQLSLIVISSFVIFLFVGYFIKVKAPTFEQIGWGLVLGGALGNLFDRLCYNCVIDFINLEFLRFPVFNFADIAVTFGTILVCVFCFFEGKKDA